MKKNIIPRNLFVITVNSSDYQNNLFYDEVRRGINVESNLQIEHVEYLFGFNHAIETFRNASGIIFAPDGTLTCKNLIEDIKQTYGIPIIQIDNEICSDELKINYDAFIGIDNLYGGKITAEFLKTFLPKDSKILVVAGSKKLDHLSYNNRLTGFISESQDYFSITEILYGEFNHIKTHDALYSFFSNTKDLPDAIFAYNDDSAITARKVIQELGINKNIYITGFDGSVSGRAALSSKQILCSCDQDPENLGRRAFNLFLQLKNSKVVVKETLIKGTLLTSKNIGNTFYPGVINFLDRALSPYNFKKRRYHIVENTDTNLKKVWEFRNELVCPIYLDDKTNLFKLLKQIDADKFILVSDNNEYLDSERKSVAKQLKDTGVQLTEISIQAGEKNKNFVNLITLLENILTNKISKKCCLVLLGGGITGNVGGLAASLLYRGVRFIHIPTTIMHMVDSSTGGKQAIDTRFGKNSIGNFSEPEFIMIDTNYIQTLPDREVRNGIAECIKHAICQDNEFYTWLVENNQKLLTKDPVTMNHLIKRTITLKTEVMDKDSYELNEGMALVYGHTLGNAFESASDYTLTHGEAISLGMLAAAKIAVEIGVAEKDLVDKHLNVLEALNLPIEIPRYIEKLKILDFLDYDKKHADKPLSFVLVSKIGSLYMRDGVVPVEISKQIINKVIDELYA